MAQKQVDDLRKQIEGEKLGFSNDIKADLEKQLAKTRKRRMDDENSEKDLIEKMSRLESRRLSLPPLLINKGISVR
jgi:hypothetical protein